jgi:hypothetical protein
MENKIEKILESLHRIELIQKDMQNDIELNTIDLAEHIKRTELLEKKLSKIYMAAMVMTGFLTARFGPEVLKIIGVLL